MRPARQSGHHWNIMQIRAATPADASSLAALAIEVWMATYVRAGVNARFADYASAEFSPAAFSALLADPRTHILAAAATEGLVGLVRVAEGSPADVPGCSDAEISRLYVQPRHQGGGVGRQLLAAALDRCRAVGARRPWLAVNSENTAALAFYRAAGFESAGTTTFTIDGQGYPNEVLAIDLRG